MLHVAKLQDIVSKGRADYSLLSDWKARQERLYPLLDTITPILGFLILSLDRVDLTVILVMYSSWQFERNLTMFPKVGRHVFINSQVTRTTMEFFLCYFIEILAFTICFHILLRDSPSFRSVDDSFVVVITMLLVSYSSRDLIMGLTSCRVNWTTV